MQNKIIDPKDYEKARANISAEKFKGDFKGCLFIYDEKFSDLFEKWTLIYEVALKTEMFRKNIAKDSE